MDSNLAPSESPRPMTVVGLVVDAYKRLRAAHFSPSPTGLVQVRGRNGQGKSSLLDAVEVALRGGKSSDELPITQGEHGARVVLDLGELVVKRTWKRDSGGEAKSQLVVENADGTRRKGPQELLDMLCGQFVDPQRFLSLKPLEQAKEALRVVPPIGGVRVHEELERLERRAEEQFAQRRDLGRDADRTQKLVEELEQQAGLFEPDHKSYPDAASLAAALQEAKDYNAGLQTLARQRDSAIEKGRQAHARVERLTLALAKAQEELAKAQEDERSAGAEWRTANGMLADAVEIDVTPIVTQLGEIEAEQQRRAKHEMLAQAREEAARAAAVHKAADVELETTREAISGLLAAAQFPVEGMTYDPESKSLRIGLIPFSQASQMEKIDAGAAIAMAGDPPIRVLFIRNASLFDEASLARLARRAEERGYQVFCELVDDQKAGPGVWIEDGEAFVESPESGA